jgi:hypothetical protein
VRVEKREEELHRMKPIATVRTYNELHAALRARADVLSVSREAWARLERCRLFTSSCATEAENRSS